MPKPNTPTALLGLWRAVEVQHGFTKGEFDFNFSLPNNVQISNPDRAVTSGTVEMFTPSGGPTQVSSTRFCPAALLAAVLLVLYQYQIDSK